MSVFYSPGIAPGDLLVFGLDFTDVLDTEDTITSATVTATNALTVSDPLVNGNVVTCWISGGVIGISYAVTFAVTTSQGKIINRSGVLNCVLL